MAPQEAWQRLGRYVTSRMDQYDLTIEQMGSPGRSTWNYLRKGNPKGGVAFRSLRSASIELGWTARSAELVLDGGEPEIVGPPPCYQESHEARITRLEVVVGLRDVPERVTPAEEQRLARAWLLLSELTKGTVGPPPALGNSRQGTALRESRRPRRRAE